MKKTLDCRKVFAQTLMMLGMTLGSLSFFAFFGLLINAPSYADWPAAAIVLSVVIYLGGDHLYRKPRTTTRSSALKTVRG